MLENGRAVREGFPARIYWTAACAAVKETLPPASSPLQRGNISRRATNTWAWLLHSLPQVVVCIITGFFAVNWATIVLFNSQRVSLFVCR